ncbi:MAG TPA: Crp/Fnr family transcriptional regulator [Candidatus Saccharimonadales bacterium]|nr:Crp/Fnr family transcriptional regulator [Candidatus Saccharimonadales bacterium]
MKSVADLFNDLPYRHFPHKHMIIYQGDKVERIYYIISGYIRIYNITSKGNERTLAILGPGESVPLIQSNYARYFSDALTDVEAAYGSYEVIVERFLKDDDYMEVVRQSGVKLMERMMEQMEALSSDSALEKVELALRFLAKHYGEEADGFSTIKFRLTHQELGNLVNLTRETVSNLLQKLEKKGLVKISQGGQVKVRLENEEDKPIKGSSKLSKLSGIRLRTAPDSKAII